MVYRFLSPEVRVVEEDYSEIVTPQHVGIGAFVGTFTWGPVHEARIVTTESHIVQQFWKPSKTNYRDFTTAAQFLGYSDHLKVIRVISDACRNATSGGDGTGLTLDVNTLNGEVVSVAINAAGTNYVPGDVVFVDGGTEKAKVKVTEIGNGGVVTQVELLTHGVGYGASALNVATEILGAVVVKNEDDFAHQTHLPQFMAKWPGEVGNSLGIGIVNASHFDGWLFRDRFITPPDADITKWKADGVTNTFKNILKDDSGNAIAYPHVAGTDPDADFVVHGVILKQGAGAGEYTATFDASTGETTFTVNTQTDNFVGNGSDYEFTLTHPTFPYPYGAKVTLNGNDVALFTDDEEEVPVGKAAIRGDKLVMGTNHAAFNGNGATGVFTIVGVTGISDARVWVDGVEKTVVSAAPANANEVQVADNGSNTEITFYPGAEPASGIRNVVIRWGFLTNTDNISVEYGFPAKTTDMVKAIWNQTGVHVVVYDHGKQWYGIKDYILEAHANLSLDPAAVDGEGLSNYYRNVINKRSLFIWMETTDISTTLPVVYGDHYLTGGVDAATDATDADYMEGWQIFRDKDKYSVTHLIVGDRSPAVKKYVIEHVAEYRKDAIAWISPAMDSVVNNPFREVIKVLEDRAILNSSSYAAMDNNWKEVYSPHLDMNVWVPCCADSAGIYSRATNNFYPWVPGAGYNRGHLVNVLRLAWSPSKTERDELYVSPHNVNPIFHDEFDGDILFGNKTMQAKESAFDRINTRLLFIVLESSLAKAAKYYLFELNTPFTRTRFRNMVVPFLRDVKALDGIEDYRVVCDSRNNPEYVRARHELVMDVLIKASYSVEYITLRFAAVGPNISFEYIISEKIS